MFAVYSPSWIENLGATEMNMFLWLALSTLAGEFSGRRPEELFSAGIQMSFAAAAGIFYLYPVFAESFQFPDKFAFVKKLVLGVLSVLLAVVPMARASLGYIPAVSLFLRTWHSSLCSASP